MRYLYYYFLLLWDAGIDVPIVLIAGTLVHLLLPFFSLFFFKYFCVAVDGA